MCVQDEGRDPAANSAIGLLASRAEGGAKIR
jgi:hypothetical protein